MTNFTADQIEDALENHAQYRRWRSDEWVDTDLSEEWDELGGTRIQIDGDWYEISDVESIGGEGQGDYAAQIFKVGDQLFRKTGYYASHYGTEWDGDLEEVEAYEKTVTSYRSVSR